MRSVLLMAAANIKRKRMQSFLIGLTMMVAALTLSTAIGIFGSLSNPVDKMFTKLNASQDIIYVSKEKHNLKELTDWLNSQPGVTAGTPYLYYASDNELKVNGKGIAGGKYITERPDLQCEQDKLQIVEGEEKNVPAPGEIWLPTGFAYINNIKAGDTVSIMTKNGEALLKVSAIVVDAQNSSPLINPVRVWVAEGEISKVFPGEAVDTYTIGIKYSDYSNAKQLWTDYEKHFGTPFIGGKLDYNIIKYVYTFVNSMLAAVLVVFSIVLIVVMILIIAFTIMSSVIADYKTIGILKAQGFSKLNVNMIYVAQYLVLAAITIPIGILLSKITTKGLLSSLLKATGTADLDASMAAPFIITILTLLFIITTAVIISARKGGAVSPVEAIRHGNPVKKYAKGTALTLHRLKRLPLSVSFSIKQIFMNKKQSIFILSAMCLAAFSFSFFINVYYSVTKITDKMAYYGMYKSDITMVKSKKLEMKNEDLIAEVKKDERVKYVIAIDFYLQAYVNEPVEEQKKRPVVQVADGDMNTVEMMNMEGRNPVKDNEVSLGINTAKEYKKNVGDYLEVYVGGNKRSFLVVGVYQTISNGGMGMRMQYSAVKEADPKFTLSTISLILKDSKNLEQFIQSYRDKYGDKLTVETSSKYFNDFAGLDSIVSSMGMAMLFVGIVFFVVSFITISNTIMIDIYRDSKNLGIYKALGMTVKQLRSSIQMRIIILTLVSSIVGIAIGGSLTTTIMNAMMLNAGIAKFPMASNVYGLIGPIVICMLIALVSSWMPSNRVKKINPRALINE